MFTTMKRFSLIIILFFLFLSYGLAQNEVPNLLQRKKKRISSF